MVLNTVKPSSSQPRQQDKILFGEIHARINKFRETGDLVAILRLQLLQILWKHLSHVMRKLVLSICEQKRCRSACAYAQSDQHLCCSLPGWYNTSTYYSRNFKTS